MHGFSLLSATQSVEKSMPFVLYRLMVYLAVCMGFLLAALVGAGTLIAFASFSSKPGSVANLGAMLGFAGFGFLLYKLRGSLFFNVKAGHLALIAEQARGVKLPEGKAQIEFAKQAGANRFSPAEFAQIDRSVGSVLAALPARYDAWIARMPLKEPIASAIGLILRGNSQAILALAFQSDGHNPWKQAELGLVLQTAHYQDLLKNRLYGLALELFGLVAAFALLLYPIDAAVSLLPVDVGLWRQALALTFAWGLKEAFFTPIVTAAMAGAFSQLAQKEEPSADLADALAELSESFREIRQKAAA